MTHKIIGSTWFTNMSGNIGIVIVQPEFGQKTAYIGIVSGEDKEADGQTIADYGSKFPIEQAMQILTNSRMIPEAGLIGVCKAYIYPKSAREKIPTEKDKARHDVCCELLKVYGIKNEMEDK